MYPEEKYKSMEEYRRKVAMKQLDGALIRVKYQLGYYCGARYNW
jgi:hypothetical protein